MYMSMTIGHLETVNDLKSRKNIRKIEPKPRAFPSFVFYGISRNNQGPRYFPEQTQYEMELDELPKGSQFE